MNISRKVVHSIPVKTVSIKEGAYDRCITKIKTLALVSDDGSVEIIYLKHEEGNKVTVKRGGGL